MDGVHTYRTTMPTITFDLDDTLIPGRHCFPIEPRGILARTFGVEPLRLGTRALWKELRQRGHRIGIYTTSFRSSFKIRVMLWCHGLHADLVVNQQRHIRSTPDGGRRSTKYPPTFGVGVHVDDLPGVAIEGERHGFRVIIVHGEDMGWVPRIVAGVAA